MDIGILITSYNDDPKLLNRALLSIYKQNYTKLIIVCVDDGSTIPLADVIAFEYDPSRMIIISIAHGERSIARGVGLNRLHNMECTHILFLDSDMVLPNGFIQSIAEFIEVTKADAVIIPEHAFSENTNYWSKVKVFERNIYQVGTHIGKTSIDAARFWNISKFPGFVNGLNAFEEIQPTLRLIEQGGKILKCPDFIEHDEKYVSFVSLLLKKNYYFTEMSTHEEVKLKDVWRRFYFFRSQLYHKANLVKYLLHPFLTAGVILLYGMLSFNLCLRLVLKRVIR